MAKNRVTEIDLLRFLAALAVVFFHYAFRGYAADGMTIMPYPMLAPVAKYGYLGVDLFFLISGFVILMTAANGSLKKFVASRIARLYPAFWACCTITFVVTLIIGGDRYDVSISQYLINLTMLSGFVGVPSVDGAYWSLFTEIKFYAFVAFLLLIRKIEKVQIFLIVWLMTTVFLDAFPITYLIKILRFLLIADYSPYFIAGALFFLVYSHGLSVTRISMLIMAWVVALSHALKRLQTIEQHFNIAFDSYIVISTITAFFLIMFLVSIKRTGLVGKRNWAAVGALTYPLYLLHENIGFMVFNFSYPKINQHALLFGTVLTMIMFASLVNKLIEVKFSPRLRQLLEARLTLFEARLMFRSGGH